MRRNCSSHRSGLAKRNLVTASLVMSNQRNEIPMSTGTGNLITAEELAGAIKIAGEGIKKKPVSYTHLTLPTILRV